MTVLSYTLSPLFLHLPNTLRTALNKDLKHFSSAEYTTVKLVLLKGYEKDRTWRDVDQIVKREPMPTDEKSFSFLCAHQLVLADSWQI